MSINEKIDLLIRCQIAGTVAEREEAREALRNALSGKRREVDPVQSLTREAEEFLTEIGVPCRILGFGYLVTAIVTAIEEPERLRSLTKNLYPYVAEIHGTTGSRVERSARHAVEVAFDRCDYETLGQHFGCTVSPGKGQLTLGEFIARVAMIVQERVKN